MTFVRRSILAALLLAVMATPAHAATSARTGLVIDCNKVVTTFEGKTTIENPCTIEDFFQQFVVVAQYAYSIIVIIGVLMIVYGGYQFLIAAGRQDKISEGKRVITGTIIGLLVSFSAYVIINFTVAAITGSPANSLNPIAVVFPGNPELQQPFSGSGGTTQTSCHSSNSGWEKNCKESGPIIPQIYCADSSATAGNIRTLQNDLNGKNCQCGTPDGCFGPETVACVRRIQIANFLPPSGAVDPNTATAIKTGTDCNGVSLDFVKNISSKLPDVNTTYSGIKTATADNSGCCVVRETVGGATEPYYCLDNVSQRTCVGLGTNNIYDAGSCTSNPTTKVLCGVCKSDDNKCISSGRYWCTNVISPGQQFNKGELCPDAGNTLCSATRVCTKGLQLTPFK